MKNFFYTLFKFKNLFLVLFILVLQLSLEGYQQQTEFIYKKIELQAESLGHEALQKLYHYKALIEKDSYKTTLKLCEGYRVAKGLGPNTYHNKFHFTKDEIAKEWIKIAQEGLAQPFSTIGGLKSEYNQGTNNHLLKFDYWFGSLYTLFLIQSLGFLEASLHCLDTLNPNEINQFAATLVSVDYEMSLASHLFLSASTGKIFQLIISKTQFFWSPVTHMVKQITQKLNRTQIIYGGLGVGSATFLGLVYYINKLENEKSITAQLLDSQTDNNKSTMRKVRFLQLYEGYEILKSCLITSKSSAEKGSDCINFNEKITQYLSRLDDKTLQEMKEDLSYYQKSQKPEDQDLLQFYKIVLPVLIELKNNNT